MAKALQKYELDSPVKEDQLAKLYSFKDKKAYYRKSYIDWDKIERANQTEPPVREKTKLLCAEAVKLISSIIKRLEKGERAIFNHKYISTLTECERKQNTRVIQQLSDKFDISYHNSVTYNGKKYRYSYEFSHKRQIQENTGNTEVSVESKMSRQNTDVYIDNKNNNIENIDLNSKEKELQETKAKILHFNQYPEPKNLNEHYPLTKEDCIKLQRLSGRGFSLNAMNEILLAISKKPKLQKRKFVSKARFIGYMTEIFKHEKRDAVKTATETFRIASNITPEEKEAKAINKYLQEIEYSLHVSPEWHLRKKLACTLSPVKAYNLLKSYESIAIDGNIAKIRLNKTVDLSPIELEIILSQIKATHERLENGVFISIQKLELIIAQQKIKKSNNSNNRSIPNTMWGMIRKQLITLYGEATDVNWFSKLEAIEDDCTKEISLNSPSAFIHDWIKANYETTIVKIAESLGVTCKI